MRFLLWWCISTAAWRLLVQTCCQKSEKTTADTSDNARAADLHRKAAMIFREVVQGRALGRSPPLYLQIDHAIALRSCQNARKHFLYTHHLQWGSDQKILSLSDFAASARNYYLQWGGRIFIYCLGTLSYYCSPFVFDVINTLIYLCMVFFVYRIIHTGRSGNWILYLFLHLAVWILVPDYGQVMFWQSGSTAYLWASIPALAVLWLFRINSVSENGFMKSWYAAFPLFLLGVLAGVAMENISAGLLVILTLSLIFFYRNGKLFPAHIACYIGAISGFLILILSPGSQRRAESGESLSLLFKFFILDYYWIWIFGTVVIHLCHFPDRRCFYPGGRLDEISPGENTAFSLYCLRRSHDLVFCQHM